jgi:oxygen-dependent protoporphyrinogen oxidase
MKKLLVIGGGLAGLGAAWEAKRAGAEARVLEIGAQFGGVVQTIREHGYQFELGPNTLLLSDPAFVSLLSDLGLDGEIVEAAPAARERFIVRDGKLVSVPMSVGHFLTTPLFSIGGKLRLLREPWTKRRPGESTADESLADFARRRLGAEAFTYGLEPFVAGIFAGDPEKLAVKHAFPRLEKMESEHGSVIRAALKAKQAGKAHGPRRLVSFNDGMTALPRALAAQLGSALELRAALTALKRNASDGWSAEWRTPAGTKQDNFDGVVITVPAHRLADLPLPGELSAQLLPLTKIEYPPVSVAVLAYPRHAVAHPLDGFGALVPRVENFSILGVLFSSTLFPGRAPAGQVLLTAFVGGSRQPELAALPDEELAAKVNADLGRLLTISAPPVFQRVVRWERAIPQYNLGHGEILEVAEAAEKSWPGLALAGSYRGGVSVPQCLATGRAAGRRALNLSPNAKE